MISGRVANQFGVAENSATGIAQGLDGIGAPEAAVVLTYMPAVMVGLSTHSGPRQFGLWRPDRHIFRSEENVERAIDDLRLRVAENLLSTGIPADDDTSWRNGENRVLREAVNEESVEDLHPINGCKRRSRVLHVRTRICDKVSERDALCQDAPPQRSICTILPSAGQ